MNNSIPVAAPVALAGCLLLVACQQTGDQTDIATDETPDPLPSIVGSSEQTRWDYLVDKYDANGDGRISLEEYDRGEERFASFDRDENGVLEEADFESSGGGRQMSPEQMRRMVSPQILVKYFQGDEEAGQLDRDEVAVSFVIYDADRDGRVTREEFETEATARGATPNNQIDRFGLFVVSLAGEGAEVFDLAQLTSYFDSLDDEGKGTLTAPRRRTRGSGAPEGDTAKVDDAQNAVGRVAPDFELERLHAKLGDELVRLSSFAGKKPVALIFGSYT